jgi:hypothetical protein
MIETITTLLRNYWPVLIVCYLASRMYYNKYCSHINDVPGPFLAGFTDLWRFSNILFSHIHKTHVYWHRKTRSALVRVGPRAISVSDPALIPTIYGLNSGYVKSKYYTLFVMPFRGQFIPSLFSTLDEDYHARYKRPVANAYAMSSLVEFEPAIDSTIDLFSSRLDEFVQNQSLCDFGMWLQMYAFDVM